MLIEDYRFGWIRVAGREFTHDLMILPDGRILKWWRRAGHAVASADLEEVGAAAPAVLVIGTGAYGHLQVLPEAERFLASRGVKLIARPTAQAVQEYNRLREKCRMALGVHLTC